MANLNSVSLIGKVYDLKPKETKSGKAMVFFNLTTYKRMGEGKDDKPQYHNLVAYGALADIIINHVTDKRELYVEAELDYYKAEDGTYKTQLIVSRFEFCDGKPKAG